MLRRLVTRLVSLMPGGLRRWIDDRPQVRRLLAICYRPFKPRGDVAVRVHHGPLAGLKLIADETMAAVYWTGGDYENEVVEALRQVTNSGAMVADIGANFGYFTLMLAKWVGPTGCVLSFEPDPRTYDRLQQHVQQNGLTQVRLFKQALSDRAGPATFASTTRSPCSRLVDQQPGADPTVSMTVTTARHEQMAANLVQVECVMLDDLLSDERLVDPALLKIDVENHEVAVLRGAKKLLKRARPALLIEAHSSRSLTGCAQMLTALGYGLTPVPDIPENRDLLEEALQGRPVGDVLRFHVLAVAQSP